MHKGGMGWSVENDTLKTRFFILVKLTFLDRSKKICHRWNKFIDSERKDVSLREN